MTNGIETADGRRGYRVTRGEGMLTPSRDFTWRGERFRAGFERVAPDHPVARSELARLLEPAYEREASPPVAQFLERQIAHARAEHPRRPRLPGKRLPPTPARRSWRLG
jgi:hypothetical protein